MNIKEFSLDEIQLQTAYVEEAVSALLHTILFVRAPNVVSPVDHVCKRLEPLTFAKCGPPDVDITVWYISFFDNFVYRNTITKTMLIHIDTYFTIVMQSVNLRELESRRELLVREE